MTVRIIPLLLLGVGGSLSVAPVLPGQGFEVNEGKVYVLIVPAGFNHWVLTPKPQTARDLYWDRDHKDKIAELEMYRNTPDEGGWPRYAKPVRVTVKSLMFPGTKLN